MNEISAPTHVAIVMDGNGRWAKKRFLPRAMGHRAGRETVRRIVVAATEQGVKVLTLFAFSSENWGRPFEEVEQLMEMFLNGLKTEVPKMHEKGVRIRFIGNIAQLNTALQQGIQEAEALTKNNTLLQLVIAVNYGGQWDVVQAAQQLAQQVKDNQLTVADIQPEKLTTTLSTKDLPPVDLFIRTSGEIRISNFLLWQLAYSELYFTEVLWPDFSSEHFAEALAEFAKRKRRFGKV